MNPFSTLLRASAVVGLGLLTSACWEAPPIQTEQVGFRGVAMEVNVNPRIAADRDARNRPPEFDPPADRAGQRAREVYQNVQVLGDLSEGEFLRIMSHITQSVYPEEGCNACHVEGNLADGSKYQYQVARRMLQMTRTINTSWTNHVGATGVTCYTCHRGQAVPANVWASAPNPTDMAGLGGFIGSRNMQNAAHPAVGRSSLPIDPFTALLLGNERIRVTGPQALPNEHRVPIEVSERTNALMVHMSTSLGVNCTFCHNSRDFAGWTQAPPQRVTAFHGIRMAREINATYIQPLQPVFPANQPGQAARLGPQGDPMKVYCATCHNGVRRPLGGAPMLQNYPELGPPRPAPQATVEQPRG